MLKELGILFDFGFMMLDPSSTFDSILENVAFLRRIVGDGSAAAEFCRMIPYDGTPIKDALGRRAGCAGTSSTRTTTSSIRGSSASSERDHAGAQDDRLDPRAARPLTPAQVRLDRVRGHRAAVTPWLPGLTGYRETLQRITGESNDMLCDVVEELVDVCRDGAAASPPATRSESSAAPS